MFCHVHIATAGPLSDVICLTGFLGAVAYFFWHFGPTLARATGWCSWWVAWACGSQGGCGYFEFFAVFGTLAWGVGTVWYARRRGHWPSAFSAKVLPRVLDSYHRIAGERRRIAGERRRRRAVRQRSGLNANRPLRPL